MPNPDSRIVRVDYFLGQDGQGYYTAMYANGEEGPRSEGYGKGEGTDGFDPERNLEAARKAAEADLGKALDIPVVERKTYDPED